MAGNNRVRNLADVVGIEAWHKGFAGNKRKADVHVDVVFMAGRLGGGANDEVRFKLALKSAEIVIIIPPTEPLKVDTPSVARDAPEHSVRLTETDKKSRKSKAKGRGKAKLTPLGVELGVDVQGEIAGSHEHVRAVSQQLQGMTLIHSQTADGDHRWTVSPNAGATLSGRPWNAKSEPRLKVVDQRTNRNGPLVPTVRVEVRCRREDLEITDIHLRDESLLGMIKGGVTQRNRQAAAEALIRTRLFEEGLVSGDMKDPYAVMVLADAQAESA